MSKFGKYTSVQIVPREDVIAYGDDLVKYIVDNLKRTISEKVLDRAELSDVIVSLKPIRVTEQLPLNQVEYRLNMTVADLVRCKDCKFSHMTYDGECKYCDMWSDSGMTFYLDGDFYCAFAERREDD